MLSFPNFRPRLLPITLVTLNLVAGAHTALAQSAPDTNRPIAKLGGYMTASAQICGDLNAAQAQASRADQKKLSLQRGATSAQFEQSFIEGEGEAKSLFASMSAADKQKTCTQLQQLGDPSGTLPALK